MSGPPSETSSPANADPHALAINWVVLSPADAWAACASSSVTRRPAANQWAIAMPMLRAKPITPLQEGRRLLDTVGWAAVLPQMLAALGAVDYVVLFAEENPLRLITAIRPEVLVKGADWPEAEIVGAAEVRAAGGRVERIALTEDRSTTGLLTRIRRTSD